jgi:hypothetical protein
MSRNYGRISTSIWNADNDFITLSSSAQRLYLVLISQPGLSLCGVLDHNPRRWARLSCDTNLRTTRQNIAELVNTGYIVVDQDTDEVLIRTFVKHERVLHNEKLLANARARYGEILSPKIRQKLEEMYPALVSPNGDSPPDALWDGS